MVIRSIRNKLKSLVLSLLLLIPAGAVLATGPVPASSLPGGALVLDSDPGAGESWGRAGGRTFTFSVNDMSNFSALRWGAVEGAAPGAAFDSTISPGTTEVMTLSTSTLSGGTAIWNGGALLTLSTGSTLNLPTRLILTVTGSGGTPIPLALVPGEVAPGLTVPASGNFTANIRFEALYSGSWHPILDLYDSLSTPSGTLPGTGGPVETSFTSGFFYDATAAGLSLEEHDANITSQLNGIEGDTAFLRVDVPNRLIGLQAQLDGVNTAVGALVNVPSELDFIKSRVQSLPTEFPDLPSNLASQEDIEQFKEDQTNLLLILFGLAPCPPEAGPLCDSKFIQDLSSQTSVDDIASDLSDVYARVEALQSSLNGFRLPTPLVVEAVEVEDSGPPTGRRWIVKTTRDGSLVNADIVRVIAISTNKSNPANVQDVTGQSTTTPLGPGLIDLTISTSPKDQVQIYQIEAQYADVDATVEGSLMIVSDSRN